MSKMGKFNYPQLKYKSSVIKHRRHQQRNGINIIRLSLNNRHRFVQPFRVGHLLTPQTRTLHVPGSKTFVITQLHQIYPRINLITIESARFRRRAWKSPNRHAISFFREGIRIMERWVLYVGRRQRGGSDFVSWFREHRQKRTWDALIGGN